MEAVNDMPNDHDSTGTSQSPSVFRLAAVVTLGVIPWLYGVHAVILGETNTWAGHIAHATRDSLLAFPLALLAVGVSLWLAGRWGMSGESTLDRVGQAAIIALAFAVCLAPSVGVHEYLDRWLDGGAAQLYHGHGLRTDLEGTTDVLGLTLHGLRDALMGLAAAFPATLLGLTLMAGWRSQPRVLDRLPSNTWASPARLVVPVAGALVAVGIGVTALTFMPRDQGDSDHASATHPVFVTEVPTSAKAEVGGLRVITRSAKWVSQVPEAAKGKAKTVSPNPGVLPDRLYLEFTVENLGEQARTFGRREVRLLAPSGTAWAPLADDFPDIVLGPQDALTTMLIFEVPAPEAGLRLAWLRGKQEVRMPIAITDVDRFAPKRRVVTQ
ncbi:MAG TPA: hypothetical protein VLM91_09275 [Candidatus Methylomirabilis sp.]|nr:hypothetical protein [Candidatus Methylomirabilis sp.]